MAERWIILTTAGQRTLRLAESLAEDGFEVWTPKRTGLFRVPRANFKRKVTLPLLPGFIFAAAHHDQDLLELAAMPVKPRRGEGLSKPAHDGFSVFRFLDSIPEIADEDLEPLRMAEKPAVERRRFGRLANGSDVRITGGSFEGLTGTVEKSGKGYAIVWVSLFGRHHRAKISTFILQPVESISSGQAARRAA